MGFSAVNEYIKEIGLSSMLSKRLTLRTFALALLTLAFGGTSRAAELGEVKVNSHIGQQLSADIELVDLTAADLAQIEARLANPDVFKGAGLDVPPVLGGLNIAIARRDSKRFLHLTTLQPVNADVLHIFLELNSAGRQTIRAASLWLTPEPPAQRAARVAAVQAAAPIAAAPDATASAPSQVAAPAAVDASPPQSAEAGLNEAAQRAFAYRRQKALEQAQARAAGVATPTPSPVPAAAVAAAPKALAPASTATARAAPAHHAPVQPQSCAPEKQVEAQIQQCQAMTTKLADIEGKVRRLQTSMAAPATGTAAVAAPMTPPAAAPKVEAAASKPAVAASKPSSAPSKPGATPVKPGVAADLAGNSRKRLTMIVGGALAGLAALGGMIFLMRKRKDKGPLKIWQSFRKKGVAEGPEVVLEEAEQVAAQ